MDDGRGVGMDDDSKQTDRQTDRASANGIGRQAGEQNEPDKKSNNQQRTRR